MTRTHYGKSISSGNLTFFFREKAKCSFIFCYKFNSSGDSTIEINVALICICLPVLKAFTRRFFPSLIGLSSSSRGDRSGVRSTARSKPHQLSSHLGGRVGRKRNVDPHEETLVNNAATLELGESDGKGDGKSVENVAMNTIHVKTNIEIESSHKRTP